MDFQERLGALLAAYSARGSALEQTLFGEKVLTCAKHETAHPGANSTYLVVFDSRQEAIFKPFAGQNAANCANYQQDPFEVVLHEVAAWRLAEAMGPPWINLMPTAAFRSMPEPVGPGALINKRRGEPGAGLLPDVFQHAQSQADAAAFWDALIGQQDRHAGNYRYESEPRSLALIDHGYAFALPGHQFNASVFLEGRTAQGRTAVQPNESDGLAALLASEDLLGLRTFIDEPRANALQRRAETMLSGKVILAPGSY